LTESYPAALARVERRYGPIAEVADVVCDCGEAARFPVIASNGYACPRCGADLSDWPAYAVYLNGVEVSHG